MTSSEAFTAARVGDRVKGRLEPPWEVFGEKLRRYEIHLNGATVEMERGPIHLEGFGLRVLRPRDEQTGVGFVSGTDLSDDGIDRLAADAEATAKFARFPARRVELPSTSTGSGPSVATVDERLWEKPMEGLRRYVHELLEPFAAHPHEAPSFGSVRASLGESTLTNSEGIQRRVRHTIVDFELAVKSSSGPEGPAAGEYWVNRRTCQLDSKGLAEDVAVWCTRARDVRTASPTPSGLANVVLPPSVLADVLPVILGFRLSGAAELRKMTPPAGSTIGASNVTIFDDGLLPFGLGSSPFDDEGHPQARRALVERGVASTPIYDVLHAGAFGQSPTGNGRRDSRSFAPWFHFPYPPNPTATNLVVSPGDLGSDEEVAEAVGDGIWVDQLGYAFPDAISGAFGGEIRIGYRIRNGKRAETIRGGTVGGSVIGPEGSPSLLPSVKGLSKSSELVGYLKSPTIWADGLGVGGAE